MRLLLVVLISGLILGLGVATSLIQAQNHALAARLDDRQRKLELTRMFILNAEAAVLAAEAVPVRARQSEVDLSRESVQ